MCKGKGKAHIGIPDELLEKKIIVVSRINGFDNLLGIIDKIAGIISEYGSPFDHIGILAREMNIPVIYNVTNATKLIRADSIISIDGINEEVFIDYD